MSNLRLNDALVRFESYLLTERRASRNTCDAYGNDLKQLQEFLDDRGISMVGDVLTDHLRAFVSDLKEKKMEPSSISRKISSLKLFFRYVKERLGGRDCAELLSTPKLKKRLPEHISPTEVQKLFTFFDSDPSPAGARNRVMVYTMYILGVRVSELVGLRVSDICLDTGLVRVNGKGGKTRLVPLPATAIEVFRDYIATARSKLVNNRGVTDCVDYLFPVLYGGKLKQITRQAFWIILKKFARMAGLEKVHPHTLRHSIATHLLKGGADLRSLQMMLGHESLSTVEIYTHLDVGHLRNVYDKKHPRSK